MQRRAVAGIVRPVENRRGRRRHMAALEVLEPRALLSGPTANDDAYRFFGGAPRTVPAPGVLANDTDPAGLALTARVATSPAHGKLALSADGSFTYTPSFGYSGLDSFTYSDSDGQATGNAATVSIEVTNPVFTSSDSFSTMGNAPLAVAAPGVLANDSDSNGNALTASVDAQGAHGSVRVAPNGGFTYTPDSGYSGTDTFTYGANDGVYGSLPTTVTITVNNPVSAQPDTYVSTQGVPIAVAAAAGVLANDADAGNQPLKASVVTGPAQGSLSLAADGSFAYTPYGGFVGTDTFTYQVSDGSFSASASVSLVIKGSVIAVPDSYATPADAALNVSAANSVLANDVASSGKTLTATLVDAPTGGSLDLHGDGSFTYTPDAGSQPGTDSFTYRASDGTTTSDLATVSITRTGTGSVGPIAVDDAYEARAGQTLSVNPAGVLANDFDSAGQPLTALLDAGTKHGTVSLANDGSFTYTPDPGYNGTDKFTYKAADHTQLSNDATVTLTVLPINQPPTIDKIAPVTILEDAPKQTVKLTGITPGPSTAGQTITITASSSNPGLIPNPTVSYSSPASTGTISFTPLPGTIGTAVITVTLTNSGGTVAGGSNTTTVTFTVAVTPVNHPPTFTVGPNLTTTVDSGLQLVPGWATDISAGPPNESGQPLTFLTTSDNPGLFSAGPSITPNGTISYRPSPGVAGAARITVRLTDNGGVANGGQDTSAPQTFTITVVPGNRPPVATAAPMTAAQGWALADSTFARFTDPDNEGVNRFSAAIDFGDGTGLTPGKIIPDAPGNYHVIATHVYLTPGPFALKVSVTEPGVGTSIASATVTVNPPSVPLTGALVAAENKSSTPGQSLAHVPAVTYAGTAPGGDTVQVFASGSPVGQVMADPTGRWTLTLAPLADGGYDISARAVTPAGVTVESSAFGRLVVSAALPRVASVSLDPRTAQLTITFSGDLSGLSPGALIDPAAYDFARIGGHGSLHAMAVPNLMRTAANQVVITVGRGKRMPSGRYRVLIRAARITGPGGTALDGEVVRSLPSGNGLPGGDFSAEIDVIGRRATAPRPYLTPQPAQSPGTIPNIPGYPGAHKLRQLRMKNERAV
jgi:VCBS repeat-containing protein